MNKKEQAICDKWRMEETTATVIAQDCLKELKDMYSARNEGAPHPFIYGSHTLYMWLLNNAENDAVKNKIMSLRECFLRQGSCASTIRDILNELEEAGK